MLKEHDNYFLKQEEPYKSCLLVLRDIILEMDENITPEWKYGLPFFYYKKKMFCYFWKDKKTKEPYIGIARRGEMGHLALEAGDRKKMKILRINPTEDIYVKTVQEILRQAMALYK